MVGLGLRVRFLFFAFLFWCCLLFFSWATFVEKGMWSSNPGGNIGPGRLDDEVGKGIFRRMRGPNLFDMGIGLFDLGWGGVG